MNSSGLIQSCSRCGTCCRKGGPALHVEDRGLVEEGFILTRDLYTIRQGELARDPVRNRLIRVESDIIKIKGRGPGWACIFFEEGSNGCRIYTDRPLECRQLECWNTSKIEQIYARDRLSRRDLLVTVEGLWELIEDHGRRCDYDRIRSLLEGRIEARPVRDCSQIAEIARYDAEIRRLMIAQGGLEPDMLDFLLGRPLHQTLPRLRRQAFPDGQGLEPIADYLGGPRPERSG
jgi:Fe-S-cluster containining protein